jgi:twitching motility protein PilT
MNEIFKKAISDGASDIHIKAGDFVRARLNGLLIPLTDQKISHAQVRELAVKLIPHEKDRSRIDELTDYDCSWGLPGLGRFRVNILAGEERGEKRGSPVDQMGGFTT